MLLLLLLCKELTGLRFVNFELSTDDCRECDRGWCDCDGRGFEGESGS